MPKIPFNITLDTDNGQVSVESPIVGNALVAYSLLEVAKDIVRNQVQQGQENRIQLAPGPLAPVPAGFKG